MRASYLRWRASGRPLPRQGREVLKEVMVREPSSGVPHQKGMMRVLVFRQ